MNDAQLLINRVPCDVRRTERGPSEQWVTLWPSREWESTATLRLIEQAKPQGIVLHAIGAELAHKLPSVVPRMRARFPGIKISSAIAGDYDRASEPGYSDGWERAGERSQELNLAWCQLNCEIAWKRRAPGTGNTAIDDIHHAAPKLDLYHTTYGAIANVDGNLRVPGHQSFGGHSGGSLLEFLKHPAIKATGPQFYPAEKDGEFAGRERQLTILDAYARSHAKAIELGRVAPHVRAYAYLQCYDTRVDVICATSELYWMTQYWTWPKRSDDAGTVAIACMSELFRRNQSIEDFQRQNGLTVDGWLGPITYKALLSNAPWKHPQSA